MRQFLLITGLLLSCSLQAGTVTLTPDDTGLRVDIDGQVFTHYTITGSQRPHMHPIIGPSGAPLTRVYPFANTDDHPHHSSLWIGHGKVNGTDFWLDGTDNGSIQHTGFSNVKAEGSTGSFTATSRWVDEASDEVLTDERVITIHSLPDGGRGIDIQVTFKATADDVTFEDTKEGTMALRVAPVLSIREGKGQILTSEGKKNKKAWGTRGNWVSFFGADPKGESVSITMMDHPSNLRHPTTWHARDYGLLAANPFGLHDFEKSDDKTKGNYTIPKGGTLIQRYRILFQKGDANVDALNASFADFSNIGK